MADFADLKKKHQNLEKESHILAAFRPPSKKKHVLGDNCLYTVSASSPPFAMEGNKRNPDDRIHSDQETKAMANDNDSSSTFGGLTSGHLKCIVDLGTLGLRCITNDTVLPQNLRITKGVDTRRTVLERASVPHQKARVPPR